jgi:hypothetical protein
MNNNNLIRKVRVKLGAVLYMDLVKSTHLNLVSLYKNKCVKFVIQTNN